ncbi:MAG: hypothetical protein B7X41_08555 [Microbacterium sp. 14-71-5]|jgi:hypothetical protein|uniref:hypothetical protein n=1 Tax=Microbacterium sp. 13-71-7 TaxID=1970399 RepID=UPI000BCD40AD|nr:hypothetical protein [Microbacterium sp. 13-71-7]OZB82540.1 MAG: hypothetical protein B7X32_13330 [Microbacterium sp. 13-71-7]OZB88361.1 MAG: hypothetical protein B7X41_08555 [Microbacterium sp. 14-71-5]
MRLTVRMVATGLALVFACYFSARALWWTSPPPRPLLVLLAVVIYLVSFAVIAIVGAARVVKMPRWAAGLALASTIAIPQLSNLGLDPGALRAPYATWYIGSVGLIGVVCIVRRRPLAGWLVLFLLTIASTLWIGFLDALGLGLVGSTVWMVIAQLLVAFWRRAVRDTDRLAGIQQAASAWQATQTVRQRERRERVQYALAVAGPILSRVIATRGDLSVEERQEAHLAEGRLRDEIRGGELLNERARAAIETARARGATVTVFDDGGLEGLDEQTKGLIREELADVLADSSSARLIIRAPRDARIAVTVVGRSAAGESSDEDSVELWREIPRSHEA